MKKIYRLTAVLICMILMFGLVGCKKVNIISENQPDKYIDAYYEFLSDQKQGFVAIDLRNLNEEYAKGHLKGFISYTYYKTRNSGETDAEYEKRMSENFRSWIKYNYSTSLTIFLVDNDGKLAKQEAAKLLNQKYKKIYVFEGGYDLLSQSAKGIVEIVTGTADCGC